MKTKSALSYFGSDSAVAGELASLLDHCSHVTIPFVGGAAILPHLKARAIVAGDTNKHAINFYRVMTGEYGFDQRERLIEKCQSTLSHPSEIQMAEGVIFCVNQHGMLATGSIDRAGYAWAYWALCWIGRKGKGGTKNAGGKPSVRWSADGGMNSSRIRAAANDLASWANEFERCDWFDDCFRDVIPKVHDKPKNGLYIDAPWVKAGKNYLHPFTEQDHRDLAELLKRFESTTVVVRYGDDPLIRELYPEGLWSEGCWQWIDAESRTQANKVRGECWITNRGKESI